MKSLESIFVRFLLKLARVSKAKNRLPVLIYHQVLSYSDSYKPMEPTVEQFTEQMQFIHKHFEVMTLGAAVDQLRKGTLPNDAIVITFDDGYRDNLYNAARVLSDRGMVATFFIATGYLNSGRMWNDTIIEGLRRTPKTKLDLRNEGLTVFEMDDDELKSKAARSIIRSIKYMEGDKRNEFVERLLFKLEVEFEDDAYMLTDDEVIQLDQLGMEIGGHTVSHPILLSQSADEIKRELRDSKQYLESLLGKKVRSFAYPNGRYGRDYDKGVASLVAEAGFDCAVSTEPGITCGGDDVYQIRRFTPWSKNIFKYSLQLLRNGYL